MASNRSKSKVLQNAEKAFKYSAAPVIAEKVPYITGTAQSAISVAKDLRDWTIRNNPFRPVNGNKDPLIRQIASATSNAVKAAKLDLKSGDLTFSRLNKSVRDFVGDDTMFEDFSNLDIDFDTDYGEGMFGSDGKDDQSSGNMTASTMLAVGDTLSRTQAVTTEAMIGAVEHSTERITKTQMVMTDTAVTRLITSNMTIAARTSTQLGTISEDIRIMNKNLSLLVEQSNAMTSFINQSQRYMENTEQSLNDIKALLEAQMGRKDDNSYHDSNDFMRGHFDFKKYINHVFNNTTTGMIASMIIGTTMKTLHMELPSFIDEMYAQPLTELNPLKMGIEKLIPAISRLGDLDKTFNRSIEMFMARLAEGEYGGFLKSLGVEGFGRRQRRVEVYDSRGYEKGNIQWNGRAQRALMEVIPGYLSNMEGYLKQIAENTYKGNGEYKLDTSTLRHYDYEYGRFESIESIRKQATKDVTDALQGSYDGFIRMTEKLTDGTAEAYQELTEFMKKYNSPEFEDRISRKEWLEEFKGIMNRHRNDKTTDAQILKAYDEFIHSRERSIDARNQIRTSASRRESSASHLGDELNTLVPDLVFKSIEEIEQERYNALNAAERREADKAKHDKEMKKSFFDKAIDKLGLTNDAKSIKELFSHGGPLNKGVDFVSDKLQGFLANLLYTGMKSYDVGSHNIPNDQVANIHKGEMIIPKDVADQIRAGNFDNEQVKDWLNITAGSVKDSSSVLSSIQTMFVGNSKTKSKTRKAMGAMVEYADDYYKVAIDAEAIKDGDLRGIWVSMLENMANQTAILAHNAERDAGFDERDGRSELSKKLLGEKDKNGLYKGTILSQYANIGLDFKNAIKHAMYGEEYTTSEGIKIAKSDDTVMSSISKGMKKAGDTALSYIFGEDYKDTKQFKAVSKGYNDFKAGVTGKASDGVQLTPDEEKAVEEALQQTADKGLELNKKLIGHVKGGLLGAITVGGIGLMGGGGVVPMLLGAGGPIGGAIIGAGLSILTRNESFMDKMFGEMKDGERVSGVISKEMQERWKDLGSKLLGPAVLGVAGSFIFPKITKGILGPVGSFMLGTGPIAGAALGIGASLIMKSQPVQDLLYGEEGKGGTTGLVGSVKNAAKEFWNKNKQHAGAMGLGGIGGALLGLKGATALGLGGFGLVGSIVGMSILGASFGLKATSDKFKDFLFGSRKFKRDRNGNLVPDGRDGDGLIGKISRKFITSVMTPARVFARSISRNFTEWIRYDVAHQLKSAFEPFTLAVKSGVQGIADGMHAVTDKLMDLAKKITNPIKKIVGGLLKFSGKTIMGGLKTGASIAGGVISAPLKVLGHFGRRFSKKYDPTVAANNKKFRFGYMDASGKKHRGFWNPLQRLADARDAFLDSDGGFFDALAAGGHMLNPFTAYADAKYQYSKDTGYKNAAFLGGFFGAAGQKHRQIKKANRRKDKMESRIADATAAWAKDDNWNDKVILNRKELNARNKRLRTIMGKDYDKVLDRFGNKSGSLTSEEMIQFMYDPFGKKKSEKDTQANNAKKANTFLQDIKHIAYEILQFVSGGKPKGAPLSGPVAKIGNALAPKGGSKRKHSRNRGTVDSSMYDFMKQAKSRGFGSISAIASATGIDVNDLKNFLAGNRDAISGKARRSMFKQMGYIDTSTFGGKVKKAFTTQHALAKYITDGQYRKSVNQKLESKSNVFKYALNAGYRKSLHQQYNVTSSKSLLDCVIDAGYFYGIKQDKKVDYRKLSADTGIDPDKLRNLLEGREDDLKDDEKTILYDKVGYVGDKFQAGKLIKNMIGTKVKNKVNSIKTTLYNKTQPLRNAAKKVQSGIGVIKGKIAPLQDKGKELFKQASEAAKFKLDNKMTSKQKEFMHKYLTPYEIKIFKQLSISERNNIMRLWATDDGRSAIAALQQHGKELKKKTDANRKKLGRNVAMTDEENATFEWLKVNAKKSKLEPDVQKTCLKVYRKMTSTERAEIEVYRKNKDVVGAFTYLKDHAGKIKSFAERVKGAAGALKAGASTIAGKAAAGASSIFGALFGTTGGLKSLAGIAIGAGLIFLFNKFPKLMEGIKDIVGGIKDWFVETAWPFITDKVIPAAKKIFETIGNGIGALVDKIVHAEEDGAAAEAAHFTGLDKTREELVYENKVAAETGLANSETMLRSIAGGEWWNGGAGSDAMMAEIAGKRAGSAYTEVDVLTALYVWLGNEYMLYNNPYVPPSEEELTTAANASEYADALKKNYKKIAKARGVKQTNYTKCSSTDKEKAIKKAVSYLNGSYGNFTSVQDQILSTKNTTKEAAAATATTYNSTHPTETTTESVGSGHFMQTDPRWANTRYANAGRGQFSTMGNGGCGPTALANAALSQGIRTNPMSIANMSRNGGYAVGGGTSAGLFTNGARRLGLRSSAIGAGSIKRALSGGNSVVFAGKGSGIYTRAGHIMSARGLDSRGNVIVDDPLRRNSISVPLSTIGRGMTHAWSIGRGADDDLVYSNNKSYPRVHSYEELSESAKNKDLTNYSDQDMGMLMAKCLRDDPSAGMNIADYYFLSERRQLARDVGLRDFNLAEAHLSLRAEAAPYITFGNGGAYIYKQVDERWSKKPLIYTGDSSTIGNSGCVITSLGSMLTNITGLNYQPDFMTQQIAGNLNTGNNLLKILSLARSPSLKDARAERFLINDHTHAQQTNTEYLFPNVTKDAFSEDNRPFSYDSNSWSDEERRFLQVISGAPFVIYGGTAWSAGNISSSDDYAKGAYYDSDAQTYYKYPFYRPSDGKKYSTHAMMVVPDSFNRIVDTSKTKFYLFDPGTSQFDAENQAREISYKDLFAPGGGVQSVFGLSGISTSAKVGMAQGEPSRDDIKWWQEMYTDADVVRKMYENTNYGEGRSYAPSTTPSSGAVETDGSDEGLLSKIMKALSGLGDIAMGLLGKIFGGKGDLPTMTDYANQSVYNNGGSGRSGYASNDDPGSSSSYSDFYKSIDPKSTPVHTLMSYRAQGLLTDAELNRLMYQKNNPTPETISEVQNILLSRHPDTALIDPYDMLPQYARNHKYNQRISYAAAKHSDTYNANDINALIDACVRAGSVWETGIGVGDMRKRYSHVEMDTNSAIAMGIKGFNGLNAADVLRRMAESGELSQDDVALATQFADTIAGPNNDGKGDVDRAALSSFLDRNYAISKAVQDGYAHQLHYYGIEEVLKAVDKGTISSPAGVVLLEHFSGIGPGHTRKVAKNLEGFMKKHPENDELTNIALAMHESFKTGGALPGSTWYSSGHMNRIRGVYEALGGTQNLPFGESVGFGGGIADSFNSGSYDIVDTPVAIGRTPRVEVDSAPVTTRLDVIINYLRQIANTARQNRAETAATNLDIGHGAIVEKRSMSSSGSNNMPATPVYTDIKNSDRMKAIHDRIARSPRPV